MLLVRSLFLIFSIYTAVSDRSPSDYVSNALTDVTNEYDTFLVCMAHNK